MLIGMATVHFQLIFFSLLFLRVNSMSLKMICVESVFSLTNETAPGFCDKVVTLHQLFELSLNITDYTVMHFNSGKYLLEHLVHFSHINHLSLSSEQVSTILCNNSPLSGFQFFNIHNLSIKNLKFEGCGAIHNGTTRRIGPCKLDCKDTVDFKSTIYVQDCVDVSLVNLTVKDGDGTGMTIYDTIGVVTVQKCSFENNFVRSNHSQILPGGNGVYVEFTYCPPGTSHNECTHAITSNNVDGIYTFESCSTFVNNNATTLNSIKTSFTASVGTYFQGMGRGGGLSVIFKGNASNNLFQVINCNFSNNWATWGGGFYAVFQDNSNKNLVAVSSSHFSNNTCYIHGGGAVGIGHLLFRPDMQPNNNKFVFNNVSMSHNQANFGGGVVLYSGHSHVSNLNNEAEFLNCTWFSNSAKFGSAVDVTTNSWEIKINTFLPEPYFKDCNFFDNFVLDEFIDHDPHNIQMGEGTFKSSGFLIKFEGTHTFKGNTGSAMHLTSSIVNFEPGSSVHFVQNSGFSGGALALIGVSAVKVNDNSMFVFLNNTSSSIGGAVYYMTIDNHNFLSSRSCFIHYQGLKGTVERNVTFLFEDNRIENRVEHPGQSMFATSLIPCMRQCNAQFTPQTFFSCAGNFTFKVVANAIATKGARFYSNSSLPLTVVPGKRMVLPVQFKDDLNQTVQAKCSISVYSELHNSTKFSFSRKFKKTFFGVPGEFATMTIAAIGFREVKYRVPVLFDECPPGYVMNNSFESPTCVCTPDLGLSSMSVIYEGIDKCSHRRFRAYIRRGYWAGYLPGVNESEYSLVTGYCPFCVYNQSRILLPDRASRELLDKICVGYRTGTLCGECRENYSLLFHSDIMFKCTNLTENSVSCKMGLFFYILSELLPATIFFIFTLVFNISFTSGAVNGFILFAQLLVNMPLDAKGLVHIPDTIRWLSRIIGLIYKMFNLDFFSIYELSFCIWEGADSLDILAMKYVTITYSLALVLLTILILRLCGSCKTCKKSVVIQGDRRSSKTKISGSFIHGLSSFFVMCYAQCASVSVTLLTPGYIHSRTSTKLNNSLNPVVLYNGELKYFSPSHLPYALPALFFLVSIVIVPPFLFIVYPLCYKLFDILKIKERKVNTLCRILPLEKLKPLFDSFQSCFEDQFRFFAGLYFLYRLTIPVTSVLSSTVTFYFFIEVELICILALHSLCHPYKTQWHNTLDTVLFFVLIIFNGLTLGNYALSTGVFFRNYQPVTNIISSIQVVLILLPLLYIVAYFMYKMLAKLVTKIRSHLKVKDEDTTQPLTLSFLDHKRLDDD